MNEPPAPEGVDKQVEKEIDGLLAETAAMAAGLEQEVGPPEATPAAREAEFFESQTDSEASLDVELAQAESALGEVAEHIGEAAPTGSPKGAVVAIPEPAPEPTVVAPAVPPPAAELDEIPTGPPPPSAEGDENTFVGLDEPAARAPAIANGSAEPAWDTTGDATTAQQPGAAVAPGRFRNGLASTLEALDQPFGWVGYRARYLLGWLALILTIAAVALFFAAVL